MTLLIIIDVSTRNKTIAKNTIILYARMIFVTLISLYTSRIILKALGVDDFGIYNIAGSLIAFFSVINTSLSSSVQRFLNIELGKENIKSFIQTFNISIEIHLIIGLIIMLLGETVGWYIFNNYLNIPVERNVAAQYVYQFSLFTTIIGIIKTPYNALIIAKEKMIFYAYLSIFEVVFKLIIVYFLLHVSFDRLILYAAFYFIVSIIVLLITYIYSKKKLHAPSFQYVSLTNSIGKGMLIFSGWSFVGNLANVGFWQGMNMWLNVFYGVALNAAMGITNQVTNAVSSFIANFQLAYKPAIIQYYTNTDKNDFYILVCRAAKYSFFLLFIVCLPIMYNIEYILELWLDVVPDYTAVFIQILLISLIINSISTPFYNAIEARGAIALYQLVVTSVQILGVFIGYLLLKLGMSPYTVVVIHVCVSVMFFITQLYILKEKIQFPINFIMIKVLYPIAKVLIVTLIICTVFAVKYPFMNMILIFCFCLLMIFVLGLSHNEQRQILFLLKTKVGGKWRQR